MNDIPEKTQQCGINSIKIERLEEKVKEIDKKTEGMPLIENLMQRVISTNESQSKAISDLNITMVKVNLNMERLSVNQDEMKKDIEGLEKKGNIDVVETITKNWWKILVAFGIMYQFVKIVIEYNS